MEYWLNIKEKIIIYFVFFFIDNNKDIYNFYLLNLDVYVQVCKVFFGKKYKYNGLGC